MSHGRLVNLVAGMLLLGSAPADRLAREAAVGKGDTARGGIKDSIRASDRSEACSHPDSAGAEFKATHMDVWASAVQKERLEIWNHFKS